MTTQITGEKSFAIEAPTRAPAISVVMPVYNGAEYLREAVESILNQTFRDFEFIIVCEFGAEDACMEILKDYAEHDARIILVQNQDRLGIAASLNRGFRMARGTYIARMDGDDVSAARRFEIQKLYMDYHTDIDILGIRHKVLGADNWLVDYTADPDRIACELLFISPLRHPCIMLRRSAVERFDLYYDESLPGVEDYELYMRASNYVRISNVLEDNLFYHRRSQSNLSLVYRDRDDDIQCRLLQKLYYDRYRMQLTVEEAMRVGAVTFLKGCERSSVLHEIQSLDQMLVHIEEKNDEKLASYAEESRVYPYSSKALRDAIYHRWMRARHVLKGFYGGNIPGNVLQQWRKGVYYRPWMN